MVTRNPHPALVFTSTSCFGVFGCPPGAVDIQAHLLLNDLRSKANGCGHALEERVVGSVSVGDFWAPINPWFSEGHGALEDEWLGDPNRSFSTFMIGGLFEGRLKG